MRESQRARIQGPGTAEVMTIMTTHLAAVVSKNKAPVQQESADCCDVESCSTTNHVRIVKHEGEPDVWLCRYHCKHYFGGHIMSRNSCIVYKLMPDALKQRESCAETAQMESDDCEQLTGGCHE